MQVFKQWPIYFIGRILPAAVGFCAVALYTRLLDPASFGTYALLLSTSFVVGLMGYTWLRVASLRMTATVAPAAEPDLMATIGLGFAALSLPVTAVIVLVVRIGDPHVGWPGIVLTAGCAVMSAWFELNVAIMQARLRVVAYSILQMSRALGMVISSVLLIQAGLKADALLGGFIIGNCAGFGAFGLWKCAFAGTFDPKLLRQMFHFGWPSSATSFSNLSATFQRYWLNAIGGSAAVGIFAAAGDFSQQTIGLLVGTATLAGQPLAFRARDSGDHQQLIVQLRNNARLVFAIGLPAAAGLMALSGPISQVYLGSRFHVHSGAVMAISAAFTFLAGIRTNYFEQIFEIAFKTRAIAVNTALRVLLTIALSFWLIGRYGAVGAAMAVLLAESAGFLLSIIWAQRVLHVPMPFETLAKIGGATAAMAATLLVFPGRTTFLGLTAAIVAGVIVYAGAIALTHLRLLLSHFVSPGPVTTRS
ncbi:MAG TPA: polysaccharide biosynthesis C-terminal domain-containing protein [Candidatus Acidoferrales bacterium]|nr:polysaccharide biosynthesis C-terminal domain-containing protein [Candidatus Acidoferrales bacterium]